MTLFWPSKTPDDVLDFVVDWSAELAGDTISTSTFAVPTGLTKASEANATETATVWLSGGTDGVSYEVENTIVTAAGRTMKQCVHIQIAECE